MPLHLSRRVALVGVLVLVVAAAAAFALARVRGEREGEREAEACPPGYVSGEEHGEEGEGEGEREAAKGCTARKHPESKTDLLKIQGESGNRARGGQAGVRSGAYAAAVRQRARLAAAPGTIPGSGGQWQPAGHGPLIGDDPNYDEVNGQGLADQNGRPSDFAFDPAARRLYAAIGEGGVWVSTEAGSFDDWRSIGDPLPTQAIGGIGYSPANGGTVIVSTGDNVFGGGGTFAGLGVFRTTDGGRTWQHASGVPGGVITFKVAVDPTNPQVVYAATGAGLYRSTDTGATFANANLPTGAGVASGQPNCTGAGPDVEGCALANMVTDVVVQGASNANTPNAKPGAVVAVVGWRAGDKTSPPSARFPSGYVESPNNGIYTSDSGAPGSFTKVDTTTGPPLSPVAANGFTKQGRIGRIELGAATGSQQNHNFLYAVVEDSQAFNGGPPVIDAPETEGSGVPNNTVLDAVYVSSDFGKTWTLMENAQELGADATSGSALTGTACAQLYCPGVQAWYNQQIAPDPTRQTADGTPTRLVFGLEEVWQNRNTSQPLNGPAQFEVVGPYFAGDTCLFLNTGLPDCPTTAGSGKTTTHPDQHASLWIPESGGGARLVVGNDGGVYTQRVGAGEELSPDAWGRGANQGLYTLLPYDAQVAKDGTIWSGLQDNGEMKIEPGGRQVETYGGDGTFSAVDPDDSNVAYESYTNLSLHKTTDGGKTWSDVSPPSDSFQFVNPFTMDPNDASHVITAGRKVWETHDGAANWSESFDLGTRKNPGTTQASSGADDPDNAISAIDTRGSGPGLPSGPHTPDFTFGDGSGTVPGAGAPVPGSTQDKPFTIGAGDGDARATITIDWASENDDWDLYVYRKVGGNEVEVGSSAQGGTKQERVVLSRPPAGDYVIRVVNYAATGTYSGQATFLQASASDIRAENSASYVGYCGYCDALNTRPFGNGVATNVRPTGAYGADQWHIATAQGLPKRFITSIQIDPSDARTVYVTLGGYSRRWLRPGSLGESADLGGGNVYRSTDAGEHFTDISGDLPDIPANWTLVRNGQLIVATNVGVFISRGTDGGGYEQLGSGLPTAPVFTLELKPKASATEKDTLIAATQGRGVYRYVFDDAGKPAAPAATPAAGGGGSPPTGGGATACKASRALSSASVRPSGAGLRLSYTRTVRRPVQVDVFQESHGRRVLSERLVARFPKARSSFTWNGRANRAGKHVTDGIYMVRFRLRESNGLVDTRRIDRVRTGGRWSDRPAHYGREGCTLLRSYKLERPAFGGTTRRSLGISYRLLEQARVAVTVRRGKTVVRRFKTVTSPADRTIRLRFSQNGRPRGDYRVTVKATRGGRTLARTLTSRKLYAALVDSHRPSLTEETCMRAPNRPRRAPACSQKRS